MIVEFMETFYEYNPSKSGLKRYAPDRIKVMQKRRKFRNYDSIFKHLNN